MADVSGATGAAGAAGGLAGGGRLVAPLGVLAEELLGSGKRPTDCARAADAAVTATNTGANKAHEHPP